MNDNKLTAKDLMLGDWVQGHLPDTYSQITGIPNHYRVSVRMKTLSGGVCTECPIDDIRPIPLAQEILEKNGWKFCENMSNSLARTFVDKNSEITFYPNAIDGCECLVRIETKPKTCGGVNHVHNCEIRHVHQLQHCLKLVGIDKEIII